MSNHMHSSRTHGMPDAQPEVRIPEYLLLDPAAVLTARSADKVYGPGGYGRATDLFSPRLLLRVEPKALALPTNHGLWFDGDQRPLPGNQRVAQPDPEDSIGWPKAPPLPQPLVEIARIGAIRESKE